MVGLLVKRRFEAFRRAPLMEVIMAATLASVLAQLSEITSRLERIQQTLDPGESAEARP
jgi:hypothetical protein